MATTTRLGVTGPLCVQILRGGRSVRLLHIFEVLMANGEVYMVPRGFETDFASVPRLFWRVLPPWGEYSEAAVVHDFLYRTGLGTRARADAVFLELMAALDVPRWKRTVMYFGVRVGGWTAWREQR